MLILTEASGGQPVVLGFPGATQQGALNLTPLTGAVQTTDLVLLVRAGQLYAAPVSALTVAITGGDHNIALEG